MWVGDGIFFRGDFHMVHLVFFCQLHSTYRTWRPLMRAKGNKKRMRRREENIVWALKLIYLNLAQQACSSCRSVLASTPCMYLKIKSVSIYVSVNAVRSVAWHHSNSTIHSTKKMQSEKHEKKNITSSNTGSLMACSPCSVFIVVPSKIHRGSPKTTQKQTTWQYLQPAINLQPIIFHNWASVVCSRLLSQLSEGCRFDHNSYNLAQHYSKKWYSLFHRGLSGTRALYLHKPFVSLMKYRSVSLFAYSRLCRIWDRCVALPLRLGYPLGGSGSSFLSQHVEWWEQGTGQLKMVCYFYHCVQSQGCSLETCSQQPSPSRGI